MKNIVVVLIILSVKLMNSQGVNARKGQLFISAGVNQSAYSNSDIIFKGNDFDFKLNNVKSDDKRYLDPKGLSPSNSNFKIGYFFNDNYNIVLGYDRMRYVLRNGQDVKINGMISTEPYDYDFTKYNYEGSYDYNMINLSESFLSYEHNVLNYIFAGVNRFDNLNKLLHINTDKFEVNLEEGIDFGLVMPETITTILGNGNYKNSSFSGYGLSASAGLNLTFFKYFFIKADLKYGYITLKDIKITKDEALETAQQHFDFIETAYNFGIRFNLFSPKKKNSTKSEDVNIELTEEEISSNKQIENVVTPDEEVVTPEDEVVILEENTDKQDDTVVKEKDKNAIDTANCAEKSAAFKEKSNTATDKSAQKGYSWLSLYYNYKCKCEKGSRHPDDLVRMINNVVDSYMENTGGIYGKINKVSKCKPLTND